MNGTLQSDLERAREVLISIARKGGNHNVNAVIDAGNERWVDVEWHEAIEAMLAFAALNRPAQSGVVERLIAAAKGVLLSAERPGSRAEYGMGPEGEVWHDYQEVGQPSLVALEAALASLQAGEAAPVVEGVYEARVVVGGMPTDCCDYGVISHATGKEVCRVWNEEDARRIANLLNATPPAPETAQSVPEGAKFNLGTPYGQRRLYSRTPVVVSRSGKSLMAYHTKLATEAGPGVKVGDVLLNCRVSEEDATHFVIHEMTVILAPSPRPDARTECAA